MGKWDILLIFDPGKDPKLNSTRNFNRLTCVIVPNVVRTELKVFVILSAPFLSTLIVLSLKDKTESTELLADLDSFSLSVSSNVFWSFLLQFCIPALLEEEVDEFEEAERWKLKESLFPGCILFGFIQKTIKTKLCKWYFWMNNHETVIKIYQGYVKCVRNVRTRTQDDC